MFRNRLHVCPHFPPGKSMYHFWVDIGNSMAVIIDISHIFPLVYYSVSLLILLWVLTRYPMPTAISSLQHNYSSGWVIVQENGVDFCLHFLHRLILTVWHHRNTYHNYIASSSVTKNFFLAYMCVTNLWHVVIWSLVM